MLVFACLACAAHATSISGTVTDPAGAPVPGAQVSLVDRLGVEAQTISAANGAFELRIPGNLPADARLVIASPGFRTAELPADDAARTAKVQLDLSPVVDSVRVVGSAIDAAASEQGGTVNLISNDEIQRRNESYAAELLRYLPGFQISQSGAPGGATSLFLRGGNSNFNLVEIDGVPVNWFGGYFDFAHLPAEALDHVEAISGPQSAVYGSYANSGAIDYVTRQAGPAPSLDVLAEGGSQYQRRFGIAASGTLEGWGMVASAGRSDDDGPVANSDYHNEYLLLNVGRQYGRQSLRLNGLFDWNDVGEPGPYGSDPLHDFSGIDLISRGKNSSGSYGGRYTIELSNRVREELAGSFFLENLGYASPYGFSFDREMRAQGEARTIVSVSRNDTLAVGFSRAHEEDKNTYFTGADFNLFPIARDETAVYLENRWSLGGRLFLNAGVRGEWIRTAAIPADGYSHPEFPSATVARANPKLAGAYVARQADRAAIGSTRLHGSWGAGMRPPTGFELAYTTNPQLKPERTRSLDAGVEQHLLGGKLSLDATYFYNRYYDLIVGLGGSLAALGHYTTGNLANSQAQGGEFSARLRPGRWLFVTGSYTLLHTRILSLDGSDHAAPPGYQVGQPLTRRAENSGSLVATVSHGRASLDLTGYFRGRALFEEPTLGAAGGLFWDGGYANAGIHVNYALGHGVTAYGNLRNALDERYEEVFGYPSPRLNFVAGLKWSWGRGK
ncbi:MAG TPA: TonB-dependent receptor [Bryobacteraceae bacterium]|nr:TonB-dependent receptor [Bryobacteraceae bacterium]